jgi:hypothetical protein
MKLSNSSRLPFGSVCSDREPSGQDTNAFFVVKMELERPRSDHSFVRTLIPNLYMKVQQSSPLSFSTGMPCSALEAMVAEMALQRQATGLNTSTMNTSALSIVDHRAFDCSGCVKTSNSPFVAPNAPIQKIQQTRCLGPV